MAPCTDRSPRIRQSLRLVGFTQAREDASRVQWMAHFANDMELAYSGRPFHRKMKSRLNSIREVLCMREADNQARTGTYTIRALDKQQDEPHLKTMLSIHDAIPSILHM